MRRSRPITWEQVRVGVVIAGALAVLLAALYLVGGIGNVFGERYQLVTLMRSAVGLVPGAPVQVAGQSAGQVERIAFIEPARRPDTGEAVAVYLAVDERVREQVRADSRARVRTQGLLGDRLIDIEPGSADQPALADGDTIASAPPLNYEELLAQAADAVQNLTALADNLTTMTDGLLAGEGTVGQLLADDGLYVGLVQMSADLGQALQPIVEGRGLIGRLTQDDELYEDLLSATARLDSVATMVVAGRGSLGRLLRSDSLYISLAESARRSDSLLASLERGEGSIGRLVTDERLYEELLKTVVDLNAVLRDLREDPSRFIPPVTVF